MKSLNCALLLFIKKFTKQRMLKKKKPNYGQMTPSDKAKFIIDNNPYLALSTCDNNVPWVAPIWYATDKNYNFYFISSPESRHCRHIEQNSIVAFSIFDSSEPPGTVDGVQVEGIAERMKDVDLSGIMRFFWGKRFKDSQEASKRIDSYKKYSKNGASLRKFYKIIPKKLFKVDESATNVDLRMEIDLKELKKH